MNTRKPIDNATLRFVESIVGISIASALPKIRKQYRKELSVVIDFLARSRTIYFTLKAKYPEAQTEILSLIASIAAALELETQVVPDRKIINRKQPKRDFILDRSGLIRAWLNEGSSIRDISRHLLSHHRRAISPTYIHQISKEMGWITKRGVPDED